MNNQKKDLLTINVASVVLALSSVVAKLSQISSVAFILGRSMVVLPFFMLICYIFKLFQPIISRWHLLLIVVSGLLMGFHWSLFYESVKVSSIVVGVVTVAVAIVFVVATYPGAQVANLFLQLLHFRGESL